ncbi:MAG TPA: TetR/AcrR family transcriptional regulator C-terminal domain-containing protein [Solirubrobacteraceae bacterium]|jgi:AcrR family transcriptional regulator
MSTGNRSHTRDEVAAAALELVDDVGLDGLSMRRLAQRLGIGTMTLYGHFRSKEELLHALVETAAGTTPPPDAGGDWQDRLRTIAWRWRRGLERHPAIVEVRLRKPILTPNALKGTEAGLQALLDAGFDPAQAARGFRTLFLYVFGYVTFSDPDPGPPTRAAIDAAVAPLDPAEFPVVAASAPHLAATMGGDEQFADGLELILTGLAERARGSDPSLQSVKRGV